MTVATIKFRGNASEENKVIYTRKLKLWIASMGYQVIGNQAYAVYNPPWTLPLFKTNEVHIEVKKL